MLSNIISWALQGLAIVGLILMGLFVLGLLLALGAGLQGGASRREYLRAERDATLRRIERNTRQPRRRESERSGER